MAALDLHRDRSDRANPRMQYVPSARYRSSPRDKQRRTSIGTQHCPPRSGPPNPPLPTRPDSPPHHQAPSQPQRRSHRPVYKQISRFLPNGLDCRFFQQMSLQKDKIPDCMYIVDCTAIALFNNYPTFRVAPIVSRCCKKVNIAI